MLPIGNLDPQSETPLYRQIFDQIRSLIDSGRLEAGAKLPPTRELAGMLGLNRATVSAAYELLEADGLISGQVGRGSFVAGPARHRPAASPDLITFANSRPSELLFPVEEFRAACSEVIRSGDVLDILQLGPPSGYAPLRRHLLRNAREEGSATETDDVLITSGCQQAFDLLQRTFVANGETVLIEDPVYPGLKNVFQRAGARVIGIPVAEDGLDLARMERVAAAAPPALIIITSNFQNPTGNTLSLEARRRLLRIVENSGALLVENDIYGQLRYEGEPIPLVKQLGEGNERVLVLRSFSKLAFPGLRVGWTIGPRALVDRLTATKQWSDLHSDQLSQAVLLRFSESGRLAEHRERVLRTGRERLRAALAACERHLPAGSHWTRPQGGMNLWVRLAEVDAGELLPLAEREGITYLPGRHFAVGAPEPGSLRISFAGVTPERIETGIGILGRVLRSGLERARERLESAVIV
jgi:2-aminoadipate transaminase